MTLVNAWLSLKDSFQLTDGYVNNQTSYNLMSSLYKVSKTNQNGDKMLDREEISQYQITVEANDMNCESSSLIDNFECDFDDNVQYPLGCRCNATDQLDCVDLLHMCDPRSSSQKQITITVTVSRNKALLKINFIDRT